MTRILHALPALLLVNPLSADVFNAGWTGNIDQQWTHSANWDILQVPNNGGGDTFSAIIGGGAGLIFLNGNVTVENVALQAGASLSISDGFQLTLRNSLTNDGTITPEGNTLVSRIGISDPLGDNIVAIAGTGEIVLDHASDRIGGSFGHTLSHEGGHAIRGSGNIGEGSVKILNSATILADSPANTLFVQPYVSLDNTGFLRADGGGILRLLTATYNMTGGELRIGDGSTIEMTGVTLNGGPIELTDTNGFAPDNKLSIIGNSTFNGTRNEAALLIADGVTLTLSGGDFTNNALITPLADLGSSSLSFSDPSDAIIALKGSGTVYLDHPNDTVTGSFGHTLELESPHLVEGGGKLCNGSIRMVNRSTITANNGSLPLVVSPNSTWINDGGTLVTTGTATAQLNAGTYTCTNGGRFLIGDDSTMTLNGVNAIDGWFAIDDLDSDPLNHHLRVVGNSTLVDSISDAVIRIDDGKTLTLSNNTLENRSLIHLDGTTAISRLSATGGGDAELTLEGSGTVFLDSPFDEIGGSFGHTLRHGLSHRIEGGGRLGAGALKLINHGTIVANLPSVDLQVAPYQVFENDGGSIDATNGATIIFSAATYSSLNGGVYQVGDNSLFQLAGGTWQGLSVGIDDVDLDPENNDLQIVGNTTFNLVTNEGDLSVDDGRTLTLSSGDFTNNSVITLNGSSGTSNLYFSGLGDGIISLLGNGIVYLDNDLDRITGSNGHTLIHDADHRIEGGGRIGLGALNVVNSGDIRANLPTMPLWIDPYSTFANDGGTVTAEAATTLRFQSGIYSSQNGGQYRIGDDALLELDGVTLRDLTLAIDDNDPDPLNHDIVILSNSTFERVVNEGRVTVNDGRTLTISGGTFVNNAPIRLDSATGNSRLTINGAGVGNLIAIEGSGSIFLDDPLDEIDGAFGHRMILGLDQSIEGSGRVGIGSINMTNHGRIEANLPGEFLDIDPYATTGDFTNDGGKLHATNDGILRLFSGVYTSSNGGDYRIFDGSEIEIRTSTLKDMTLAVENTNGILADNHALIAENCTMSNVVLETLTEVAPGKTLTLNPGDLTNNGDLVLNGDASNTSTVSAIGLGDALTRIDGTGRLLLDHVNDQVRGAYGYTLVNGSGHRIEGAGSLGLGEVKIINEGGVTADITGQTMQINCFTTVPFDNRGVLHASGGGVINIADALSDTGGIITADLSSSILISGNATKTGGSLTVNGLFDPSGSTSLNLSALKGSGILDSPTTATFTNVTPGNSTGTLSINGATTLGAGTSLGIEVNSTADHDLLAITGGNLILSGSTLRLDYLGGPTDVLATDTLTIVTSSGALTNEFLNIADGARLYTANGVASFVVNYLPNSITLTDFIYNPSGPPNQPPVFTTFVENLTVDENTESGTLLTTFFAYDPEGVYIEYSIDDAGAPFEIHLLNGELRVNGALNHELESSHVFNVRAFDQENYGNIELTIDINDLIDTNQEITESLLTGAGGPFEGETDPAIVGYDADPDFDGRSNIYELWRGTDPSVTDPDALLLLAPIEVSSELRGSATLDVDAAMDDLLAIDPLFSLDLSEWRNGNGSRAVLADSAGERTLRFIDSAALGSPPRFFVRFSADPDGEK